MKNYLKSWNLARVLRLAIGVIVIMQGIEIEQWLLVGMGVLFAILSFFNVNMCATGSCGVPTQRRPHKHAGTAYDEVK